MNRRMGWSETDNQEHDDLRDEVFAQTTNATERGRLFVQGILDAEQAQRRWAKDLLNEMLVAGATAYLKQQQKGIETTTFATGDGRAVTKPRVVGVQVQDDSGDFHYDQLPLEVLTQQQIIRKRRETTTQIGSLADNVAVYDRLLALFAQAPKAKTCGEAARRLGTTVDAWLSERAA